MDRTRVLLVDDQTLFVDSLRVVIESRTDDIVVAGVAYSGEEAVRLYDETDPDVVMMDVRMPGMDGVEATRIIRERHPESRIVMLTTYDDDEYVTHAIQYGAAGYILKNIPPSELIACIRVAVTGTVQISPGIASRILQEGAAHVIARHRGSQMPDGVQEQYETLTPREREVLALLIKAYDNSQIAEALGIAHQTVKNHIHLIYEKLMVQNRMQLMQLVRAYDADRHADE